MTKLSKLLGKTEDRRVFKPDFHFVLPECRMGVEFEFERTGNVARFHELPKSDWSHYWAWHEEGTLRDGGSELVFIEPLFGKDAYEAIQGLCAFARQNRWSSTMRTGVHVHIDIRDLEAPQLIGMCLLYALFEPVVYRWVGDNRDNSNFCIPWYKSDGSILEAAAIVRAATAEPLPGDRGLNHQLIESAEQYQRYSGLNLQAIQKFGSVEWRHLKTTDNVDRLITWINILQSFKAATFKLPQSDNAVIDMVRRHGARRIAADLFGDVFALIDYPEFERDVQDIGIPTAVELAKEGLSAYMWENFQLPTGVHPGFAKFMMKETKEVVREEQNPFRFDRGMFVAAPIGVQGFAEPPAGLMRVDMPVYQDPAAERGNVAVTQPTVPFRVRAQARQAEAQAAQPQPAEPRIRARQPARNHLPDDPFAAHRIVERERTRAAIDEIRRDMERLRGVPGPTPDWDADEATEE